MSWYIISVKLAFYTSIEKVEPGTVLTGIMDMATPSDDTTRTYYPWQSTFLGYPATTLNITTTTNFSSAYETLETYNCVDASYLPTGKTAMYDINLKTESENPTLEWETFDDAVDDISIVITNPGSIDGEVVITYPRYLG